MFCLYLIKTYSKTLFRLNLLISKLINLEKYLLSCRSGVRIPPETPFEL